jgi:hypothetical protein
MMNNHGMKEKLYKEKVSENNLLNYTTRSTKLNLSTEFLLYSFISYSLYSPPTRGWLWLL